MIHIDRLAIAQIYRSKCWYMDNSRQKIKTIQTFSSHIIAPTLQIDKMPEIYDLHQPRLETNIFEIFKCQ